MPLYDKEPEEESFLPEFLQELNARDALMILLTMLVGGLLFTSTLDNARIYFTGAPGWQETGHMDLEDVNRRPWEVFCFRIDSDGNYNFAYLISDGSGIGMSERMDYQRYGYVKTTPGGNILEQGRLGDYMVLEDFPIIDDNGNYLSMSKSYCLDMEENIYFVDNEEDGESEEYLLLNLTKWDRNGEWLFSQNSRPSWGYEFYFWPEESSIEIDARGHINLLFDHENTIHFAKLDLEGRLIMDALIDPKTHSDDDYYPSVIDQAPKEDGGLYLVWNICVRITITGYYTQSKYSAVVLTEIDEFGVVEKSERISYTLSCLEYPAVELDSQGNVHVLCTVPSVIKPMYKGEFFAIHESNEASDTEGLGWSIFSSLLLLLWIITVVGTMAILLEAGKEALKIVFFSFLGVGIGMYLIFHLLLFYFFDFPMFDGRSPPSFYYPIALGLMLLAAFLPRRGVDKEDERGGFNQNGPSSFKGMAKTTVILLILLFVGTQLQPGVLPQPEDSIYTKGTRLFGGGGGGDPGWEPRPPQTHNFDGDIYIAGNDSHEFVVEEGPAGLEVGLWGDNGTGIQNDIDLYLYDEGGSLVACSEEDGTSESFELYSDSFNQGGSYTLKVVWRQSLIPVGYEMKATVYY